MAEHYFMAVDGKIDFLVFNGDEQLTDEFISDDDIEFIEIQNLDQIKSMAWSSNCEWSFIIQPEFILLINTYDEIAVKCNKKSKKFIEWFLDANRQ